MRSGSQALLGNLRFEALLGATAVEPVVKQAHPGSLEAELLGVCSQVEVGNKNYDRSPTSRISRSVSRYASPTQASILSGSGEYSSSIDMLPSIPRDLISRK
jgi:hypothetical protein